MSNNVLAAKKNVLILRYITQIIQKCQLHFPAKIGLPKCANGTTVVPAGVNRLLRCGRCAYRFRDVVDSRVSPNERDIARLALWDAGGSSLLHAYPAFVHAPRCDGVGGIVVVVDQQAHAARSRGFRRGSTWRVIHRVAGITLARWLQLVVAGPRGPMCKAFFLPRLCRPPLLSFTSGFATHDWSSCV